MPTRVERVVALGDSYMLGLGVSGAGWVQMLHARYRELNDGVGPTKNPRIFYELGVFAARAYDLAENAVREVDPRLRIFEGEEEYDIYRRLAIVSIGTNDSWLRARDGTHVTPLDEFSDSISRIATGLTRRSQVLFAGLLPCDERKCGEFWQIPTPPQRESRVAYETEAIRIFESAGAVTVPLVAEAYDSPDYMAGIGADGVHGNQYCEDWIYRRVVPHFDRLVSVVSPLD